MTILIIIFLAIFLLFGITGVMTVGGMVLLFIVPIYVILNNFNLEPLEKIVFSFFIGLVFFPLSVWYINRLIVSLRISIAITFVLLITIGIIIKLIKRKK